MRSATHPKSAGSTTTVTAGWFLAAARSIVGPPMSMFSSTSWSATPSRLTVASKGYRLPTSTSMVSMPWACSSAMCSGRSRRASRPPCTTGCSVFTRPSSISGEPVTSDTCSTAQPRLRERPVSPARADQPVPCLLQSPRQLHHAGLVVHADERLHAASCQWVHPRWYPGECRLRTTYAVRFPPRLPFALSLSKGRPWHALRLSKGQPPPPFALSLSKGSPHRVIPAKAGIQRGRAGRPVALGL